MTNLNWFGARNLAVAQTRAIRRAGWTKWLLFRFNLWIVSEIDPATGLEVRRVVTAPEFRDSEFLAKDWTDEPWTGGSTPPCTTLPPAPAAAANVTGGLASWTFTDRCAGEGQGGGVVPVMPPLVAPGGGSGGGTGPHRLLADLYPIRHTEGLGAYNVPATGGFVDPRSRPRLIPDGPACWLTFPPTPHWADYGPPFVPPQWVMVVPFTLLRTTSANPLDSAGGISCWLSWTGHNFAADPFDVLYPFHLGDAAADARGYSGADLSVIENAFVFEWAPNTVTVAPGSTITARVAFSEGGTGAHAVEVVNLSYTFTGHCSSSGLPVGGP